MWGEDSDIYPHMTHLSSTGIDFMLVNNVFTVSTSYMSCYNIHLYMLLQPHPLNRGDKIWWKETLNFLIIITFCQTFKISICWILQQVMGSILIQCLPLWDNSCSTSDDETVPLQEGPM